MKGNERLLRILAAAAAVIIVIYFAAEMYSLTSRAYTSETIYEQTVLETVDAKMYVIRDETLLSTTSSGVTVPLLGFGDLMANGVKEAVGKDGALGIITGGLTAGAAGIALVIILGVIAALICKPKDK